MSFIAKVLAFLMVAAAVTAVAAETPAGGYETTQPAQGTANGKKEDPQSWWRGNCERIQRDINKMEGKIDICFVGDSITARWNGESWTKHWGAYRAVNMGIGADATQNVLWRLQNGQLDGYQARLFVVLIGTNNCWGKNTDPVAVAAGIKAVIDLIHAKQPKAQILLLSILPNGNGEKAKPGREVRTSINTLIAKYHGGPVHYMDISAKFLEPDGTISKEVMGDALHLAPKGFDIWAESIKGKVDELLAAGSNPKK